MTNTTQPTILNQKLSWVFSFSFSDEAFEQDYLQALKDEMTNLMDHRSVFREEVPATLRVNYVYNGISPEDALKYMYRLSNRTETDPYFAVKIYQIIGNPYVQN